MSKLFVPLVTSDAWKNLLAQPELHWEPGYSAMCTAAAWMDCAGTFPPEIRAALDSTGDRRLMNLELLLAVPEWKVPLKGGSRSSCTDVMALGRNEDGLVVVAVEAKVDEPFGPTFGEKRRVESNGQKERLEFLEVQLGVKSPLPDDTPYQLVHRTVSAVLTAKEFHAGTAVMLVQSFSPTRKWRDAFDRFAAILRMSVTGDGVARVPGRESPRLFIGWCSGDQKFRQKDLRGESNL